MWHHSFICDMIHSHDRTCPYMTWIVYMRHDSFICNMTLPYVTWLTHIWHDSFIRDMNFICDMIHSCLTWLIHMYHDSFICDMTHPYVTWMSHVTYEWVTHTWRRARRQGVLMTRHMCKSRFTWISHVSHEWVTSHMNESRHVWTSQHSSATWSVDDARPFHLNLDDVRAFDITLNVESDTQVVVPPPLFYIDIKLRWNVRQRDMEKSRESESVTSRVHESRHVTWLMHAWRDWFM